jgi:hypothetical protein
VAQALKVLIALLFDRRLSLSYLVSMGGMPSAHTTLVCALATTVAIVHGVGSTIFAVAALFALVVMYDAAGLRRTVSTQSTVINRILDELLRGKPAFEQRVRELVGHSRLEVLSGAALGILVAWLWP